MYTIEKLKERNKELADEIRLSIEQYVASTGVTPSIEIVWHSSICAPARPVVYVEAVVR